MSDLDEAVYRFSKLLEELELEYASDAHNDRLVVPTNSTYGIVVEFVELEGDGSDIPCAVMIVPLLHGVDSPSPDANRTAVAENANMLFGKLVIDESGGTVELRHELPIVDLSANALSVILGALSAHIAMAERLELVFGGQNGPSYDALLGGA